MAKYYIVTERQEESGLCKKIAYSAKFKNDVELLSSFDEKEIVLFYKKMES